MPALHGFIVEWPLATPTIGLSKSPSPKPTARSIARLGERATPWVMRRERRLRGCHGSSWSGLCAAARPAIQCNRDAAVILYGYGSAGIMAVAVFRGGGRAPALRPRRGGAAHLPAAAVARDPRARGAARRGAVRAQPAARRAHRRGHAAARARRGASLGQLERTVQRGARHGARRGGAAAHRLRLARRLRRAARAAEGVQVARARASRSRCARCSRPSRRRRSPPASSTSACCCRRCRAPASSSTSWCSASASSPRCRRAIASPRPRASCAVSALAGEPFVMVPREIAPGLYDIVTGLAARAGISFNVAQEAIQMQTVVSLVSSGLGAAIVPGSIANLGRRGVVYRELADRHPRLDLWLAWPRSGARRRRARLPGARAPARALGRDAGPPEHRPDRVLDRPARRALVRPHVPRRLRRRLVARRAAHQAGPSPPITRQQLDDLLFLVVLGVILGGRLGYVLFYKPGYYLAHPLEIFYIWQGGMSFHGGLLGVMARHDLRRAQAPRRLAAPDGLRRAAGAAGHRRRAHGQLHQRRAARPA